MNTHKNLVAGAVSTPLIAAVGIGAASGTPSSEDAARHPPNATPHGYFVAPAAPGSGGVSDVITAGGAMTGGNGDDGDNG